MPERQPLSTGFDMRTKLLLLKARASLYDGWFSLAVVGVVLTMAALVMAQ
jgi:hypothetical protein